MKDPLLRISAYSPKIGKHVDLNFISIKEARKRNPTLKHFAERGFFK